MLYGISSLCVQWLIQQSPQLCVSYHEEIFNLWLFPYTLSQSGSKNCFFLFSQIFVKIFASCNQISLLILHNFLSKILFFYFFGSYQFLCFGRGIFEYYYVRNGIKQRSVWEFLLNLELECSISDQVDFLKNL